MAKTKAQIRDRAATDLGVLMLNQSLQSQDDTRISAAYDEVFADLRAGGIAAWASTGSVPDEYVPHVVALVARNCMSTYGVSDARAQRILLAAGPAKREIRRLIQPHYESQSEPRDF